MNNSEQPAFPITEEQTDRIDAGVKIYTGLTKREYFAGLAMQGLLASTTSKELSSKVIDVPSEIVFCSVEYADLLIKQLETKKP